MALVALEALYKIIIKGGSRHFDLGGLYNGKSWNLMKIQAPLGGSGGMPPQEILTYSCSETASGAIWGNYFASNSTRNFGG